MELSPKALEDPEGPVWTLEEALWSLYLGQPPVLLKEPQPYSGRKQELGPLLPGTLPTSTCSPAGCWKAQNDGLFLQGLGLPAAPAVGDEAFGAFLLSSPSLVSIL